MCVKEEHCIYQLKPQMYLIFIYIYICDLS